MQSHAGASSSGGGSSSSCGCGHSCALTIDRFDFPPGYRFKPTDEELIVHYLRKKIDNQPLPANHILEVDIYDQEHDPKRLLEMYKPRAGEKSYFFTSRKKKYPNGQRPDRAAGKGYWKATTSDKDICFNGVKVGSKKALVFYMGKPPLGIKTDWLMQEYTVPNSDPIPRDTMELDYCLCEIYKTDEKRSHQTRQNSTTETNRTPFRKKKTSRTLVRVNTEDLYDAEQMGTVGSSSNSANVEHLAIMYGSYDNYQAPNSLDFNYPNHHNLPSTANTSFDYLGNVNITELPVLPPQLSAQDYIAIQDPSMGINAVSDQMFDWDTNFGSLVLQQPPQMLDWYPNWGSLVLQPPPPLIGGTPSLAEHNISAEQSNNNNVGFNSTETGIEKERNGNVALSSAETSMNQETHDDCYIMPMPELNDISIQAYYENYFADDDASGSLQFNFRAS